MLHDIWVFRLERFKKWRELRIGPTFMRLSHRCVRYEPEKVKLWLRQKGGDQ
jgi:hypothetical protein